MQAIAVYYNTSTSEKSFIEFMQKLELLPSGLMDYRLFLFYIILQKDDTQLWPKRSPRIAKIKKKAVLFLNVSNNGFSLMIYIFETKIAIMSRFFFQSEAQLNISNNNIILNIMFIC